MLCPGLGEIAGLPLMTDGKNEHDILLLFVAVQRHVSRLTAGDKEFTEPLLDRPPDKRVVGQDLNSLDDQARRFVSRRWIYVKQEVGESAEVRECPTRVDQLRQVLALGFGADSPRALARRYAWTSAAR